MSGQPGFRWSSACVTDVGRVRTLNEDAPLDMPQYGVWAVSDGMGGHDAGELASDWVIEALSEARPCGGLENLVEQVKEQLTAVNTGLMEEARRRGGNITIGCAVVVLLAYGNRCACLWAGDSRIYRLRDGSLSRLTRDHSQIEEWIERGYMLREDAERHPEANVITRAVGGEAVLMLDQGVHELKHRDRFLLCSDGLYKELSEAEIAALMMRGNCADVCRGLVDLALSRACRDNVTVVAIEFEEAL